MKENWPQSFESHMYNLNPRVRQLELVPVRRPRVSVQRWRGNHREFCVLSILSRWVPEVLGLQQQLMPYKDPLALGLECSQKNTGNLFTAQQG